MIKTSAKLGYRCHPLCRQMEMQALSVQGMDEATLQEEVAFLGTEPFFVCFTFQLTLEGRWGTSHISLEYV